MRFDLASFPRNRYANGPRLRRMPDVKRISPLARFLRSGKAILRPARYRENFTVAENVVSAHEFRLV